MTQALNEFEVVTETKAAEILGLAVQTLRNRRHMRAGCPYIRMGRSIRYGVNDLLDYLDRHRIDPENAA